MIEKNVWLKIILVLAIVSAIIISAGIWVIVKNKDDNTGDAIIQEITIYPNNPSSNDNIIINATVTNEFTYEWLLDSGLKKTAGPDIEYFTYSNGSGSGNQHLFLIDNNTFSISLGTYPEGTDILFFIRAYPKDYLTSNDVAIITKSNWFCISIRDGSISNGTINFTNIKCDTSNNNSISIAATISSVNPIEDVVLSYYYENTAIGSGSGTMIGENGDYKGYIDQPLSEGTTITYWVVVKDVNGYRCFSEKKISEI